MICSDIMTDNENREIITDDGENRESSTHSDRKKRKHRRDWTVSESESESVEKQDTREGTLTRKKCVEGVRKRKRTRHERNMLFRIIIIDSLSEDESADYEKEKRESQHMCEGKYTKKENEGDMKNIREHGRDMKMEHVGKNKMRSQGKKVFRRIKKWKVQLKMKV